MNINLLPVQSTAKRLSFSLWVLMCGLLVGSTACFGLLGQQNLIGSRAAQSLLGSYQLQVAQELAKAATVQGNLVAKTAQENIQVPGYQEDVQRMLDTLLSVAPKGVEVGTVDLGTGVIALQAMANSVVLAGQYEGALAQQSGVSKVWISSWSGDAKGHVSFTLTVAVGTG